MDDNRLKLILAALGGLVFSLVFILLAFVLPLKDTSVSKELQAKHTLEAISRGIKEGQYSPPPGEKQQNKKTH